MENYEIEEDLILINQYGTMNVEYEEDELCGDDNNDDSVVLFQQES